MIRALRAAAAATITCALAVPLSLTLADAHFIVPFPPGGSVDLWRVLARGSRPPGSSSSSKQARRIRLDQHGFAPNARQLHLRGRSNRTQSIRR